MTYKDERYFALVTAHMDALDDEQLPQAITAILGENVTENSLDYTGHDILGNPYAGLYLRGLLTGAYVSRAKVAYDLSDMQAIGLREYFRMCFVFPNTVEEGDD